MVDENVEILKANTLALNATAEVLQKFNSFLDSQIAKEEEEEEKDEKEKELEKAAEDYQALIKDVASAVVMMLKEKDFGMEVEGKDEKKVGGEDKWPMGPRLAEEDKEMPVKLDTETKNVQKPIQAADVPGDKEKEEDKKGADEFPMEEDEKDEDEEAMKAYPSGVRKALEDARAVAKELADLKKALPSMIKEAADARLKKMGFREEKSTAPKIKSLGVEDELPIKKSDEKPVDITEELMKLSFRDLNRMHEAIRHGATEGLPEELARLKS